MLTGDDFFESDEFKDILSAYEMSESSGVPPFLDADELTDIADYYMTAGNSDKARAAIDKALELFPGATAPLAFKAREALNDNDVEKAQLFAGQIEDKSESEYQLVKAEILVALDKIERADALFHEQFQATTEDNKENLILDVVNVYLDYAVFDKAHQWLGLSKVKPTTEHKEFMARTLVGLGKLDEGITLLNKLIDQAPYSIVYWNALATAYLIADNTDESLKSIEYALAIDPNNPDALFTKANCLYKMDNFIDALKCYRRFAESEFGDKELGELNVGMCLVNLEDFENAISHLQRALAASSPQSPNLALIYQELAFAHSANQQPEKAIEYIDLTETLDCDHTDIDILHGHILLENGHNEEAMGIFRRVMGENNYDPHIVLRVIVSIYDNKYYEIAYEMFKKLFETEGEDFDCGYSYMALCCRDLNKSKEFLHYFKIAIERNPKEAKKVFGNMFPAGMSPKDYLPYIKRQMGQGDM